MNISRNFFILLLFMVSGCDNESHIDYSSFNITPEIIPHQKQQGFIITDTYSPFNTPLEFKNLEYSTKELINSNWLSNPHYLEDIKNLIYQFNQINIKSSAIFIQALNNSALIYKTNMIEVNILKRALQKDVNQKLNHYQQELASINTHLEIIKKDEKQHIENINTLKTKIKEKQQHYTKLRRSLKSDLETILLNNDLVFDLISNINFKYKKDKALYCPKYLDVYQNINVISSNDCIYYNKEELISKIPKQYQHQVDITFNKYIPELWETMVKLNGYFESNYNKQVFDDYLQKDLMIANNDLIIKRTMKSEQNAQYSIKEYVNKSKQLHLEMNINIDKYLLDDNNRVDISSAAFYKKLSPLLTNNTIKNPIINFSLLYNNKNVVEKFTQQYATKILNEYPKTLSFHITNKGNFILPKIKANRYKIVIDIKESYSVIYNNCNILASPVDLTQQTPNTTIIEHNLNQIIRLQLFKQWYNS
ncbi:hypothetical protein [Photobacterium phosphoreum]|uniref:hypothetical protein n=1 Tax=Photobacterium phosphoreum TaxID=659 RepID=UPI001E4241A7|nr:hypothetical protein [Photobacterium phosphoreum]MCD9517671.1 hypothetical protein [Photobacterium phosphoreum]